MHKILAPDLTLDLPAPEQPAAPPVALAPGASLEDVNAAAAAAAQEAVRRARESRSATE